MCISFIKPKTNQSFISIQFAVTNDGPFVLVYRCTLSKWCVDRSIFTQHHRSIVRFRCNLTLPCNNTGLLLYAAVNHISDSDICAILNSINCSVRLWTVRHIGSRICLQCQVQCYDTRFSFTIYTT